MPNEKDSKVKNLTKKAGAYGPEKNHARLLAGNCSAENLIRA
jgi:hypothetical protein